MCLCCREMFKRSSENWMMGVGEEQSWEGTGVLKVFLEAL